MGDSPAYAHAAQAVGSWIGQHQGQLIYGGGNNGLMGVVAQATAQAGGRVVGVIPQALVDKEVARLECDELHVVQTMHERKQMMAERADAFLAIPGGIGTLEEFFEVWSWRQLGYHRMLSPGSLASSASSAPWRSRRRSACRSRAPSPLR